MATSSQAAPCDEAYVALFCQYSINRSKIAWWPKKGLFETL